MTIPEFVQQIRKTPINQFSDEVSTKQGIILPILQILGWNPFLLAEVKPEYAVEGGRVDYALIYGANPKVFIEAKKPSEDLEKHERQLLKYSFHEGVSIAVLTNGFTWWFYLPTGEGMWTKRKFYSIDLREQTPEEITQKFSDFLSKANIVSGQAANTARSLLESHTKESKIKQAMPEAWNKIMNDPDDSLVDLVASMTERLCGHRPPSEQVARFIEEQMQEVASPVQNVAQTLPRRRRTQQRAMAAGQETVTQNELIAAIVQVLKEKGGSAYKADAVAAVFERFKTLFSSDYYQEHVGAQPEKNYGGIPRWQKNVEWARNKAKDLGFIKHLSESTWGLWELTNEGWNYK